MYGFGQLADVAKIKSLTEGYEDKELVNMDHRALTNAQEAMLENITVHKLNDDKYIASDAPCEVCEGECTCSTVTTNDTIGSAGNAVDGDEPEAQLGCVGGGLNMKKEFARTESEDGGGMIVDESPQKNAESLRDENTIDKVKDFFDEFQITMFTDIEKKYDLDSSKPKSTVSNEPIKRIPRGW